MTKEDISKYAYLNEMPDKEMTCPERCLWYALRDVYRRFQSGDIKKEQSIQEKNRALKQFELDSGVLNSAKKIVAHNASMWAEIELAGSLYSMDRTLENADAFLNAVYGVRMKREGSTMQNRTGSHSIQQKEGG